MQKTIHICDVCNTETENYNMHVVKMAVHELDEPITVCELGVCITCLSATGFKTGSGGSYENRKKLRSSYAIWVKWFSKFRK